MKIIALEEHYLDHDIAAASAPLARELSPDFGAAYAADSGLPYSPPTSVLADLGAGRLADMDANGISMQVLSCLSTQQVPAGVAADLVRRTSTGRPGPGDAGPGDAGPGDAGPGGAGPGGADGRHPEAPVGPDVGEDLAGCFIPPAGAVDLEPFRRQAVPGGRGGNRVVTGRVQHSARAEEQARLVQVGADQHRRLRHGPADDAGHVAFQSRL